jgi:hypothetical protein
MTMLEASIAIDDANGADNGLGEAIAEHRASQESRARREEHRVPRRRRDTGERDRTSELRGRRGWAWLRPVRSLPEYERALGEFERSGADAPDETPVAAR